MSSKTGAESVRAIARRLAYRHAVAGLPEDEAPHFVERPAEIERFVLSERYLGLSGQIAPGVLEVARDILAEPGRYREAAVNCGIGWGKTFAASILLAYLVHRALCLRSPQSYYGLAAGSNIAFLLFGESHAQTKEIVFGELEARILGSPWFRDPRNAPDPNIRSVLRFPRSDHLLPMGSKPAKARGWNVLAAVVDAASWLPVVSQSQQADELAADHSFDAAEEIYNGVADRIRTRGNQRWQRDSLTVMVSSPRTRDDFLERKLAEASSNKTIYAVRRPTWSGYQATHLSGATFLDEVCGKVPVEFEDRFRRDPVRARRDLGAVPSAAVTGYFPPGLARAAANTGREPPYYITGPQFWAGDWVGEERETFKFAHGIEPRWRPGFRGEPGQVYSVHVDLAAKQDRCGIAMGHADENRVVVDLMMAVEAKDHGGQIEFARVRALILELVKELSFNVQMVTFDGWQSIDSRQILRRHGLRAELLSVDRTMDAYATLLELMTTRRLDYWPDELFMTEVEHLELVDGRKVDHGPRHGKDLSDAVAGVAFTLTPLLRSEQDSAGGVTSSVAVQGDGKPAVSLHEAIAGEAVHPADAALTRRFGHTAGGGITEEPGDLGVGDGRTDDRGDGNENGKRTTSESPWVQGLRDIG